MPELPEVETICRGIRPFIEGKKITNLKVRNKNMRWPIPSNLKNKAEGQKVLRVDRRSKYILLRLENGTIIIHFGMSGILKILNSKTKILKHDHVDIVFDNVLLRLNDPRRFGCVLWTDVDPLEHKLLKNLAPEPLGKGLNTKYFYAKFKNRKAPVKNVIMDSKTVVGVGNIYASESLFLSGINPLTPADKISKEKLSELVKNIKKVLRASIKAGGTTLKNYVQTDGKPGYFAQKLRVYGREGKECRICKTPIRQVMIGQRATYYCPECQPGDDAVI